MTFSIVARSDDGESWGVAVASKFLAVGAAVSAARADVGAIATQADANVAYKRDGLSLLGQGGTAEQVLAELTDADEGRDERQLGIVDRHGNAASFTGTQCLDWCGGRTGSGYSMQGNVLAGPHVLDEMEAAWVAFDSLPFTHRLLGALAAADGVGGDRRGRQSAALLVVRAGAGYAGRDDVAVDLRVDDHARPIDELTRLLALNDLYLTPSTQEEQMPVTAELAAELEALAQQLGHRTLWEWVGTENYEMRAARDGSWIDRQVLDAIRRAARPDPD